MLFLRAITGHYLDIWNTLNISRSQSVRKYYSASPIPCKKWHLSVSLLTSSSPIWPPGNYWGGSRGILDSRNRRLLSLIGYRLRMFDVSVQLSAADWSEANLSRKKCARPLELNFVDSADWPRSWGKCVLIGCSKVHEMGCRLKLVKIGSRKEKCFQIGLLIICNLRKRISEDKINTAIVS